MASKDGKFGYALYLIERRARIVDLCCRGVVHEPKQLSREHRLDSGRRQAGFRVVQHGFQHVNFFFPNCYKGDSGSVVNNGICEGDSFRGWFG